MTHEPPHPPRARPSQEAEHLQLLAVFHYVVAALVALIACLPLLHVAMGIAVVLDPDLVSAAQGPPLEWFGYAFIVVGVLMVLAGWALAVCTFLSGRYLSARRNRTFSIVVAGVLCLFPPFGTVLGIFTIIVLSREPVQHLYAAAPSSDAA